MAHEPIFQLPKLKKFQVENLTKFNVGTIDRKMRIIYGNKLKLTKFSFVKCWQNNRKCRIYLWKVFTILDNKLFTMPLFELIGLISSNDNIKFAYLSTHDVVIFSLVMRLTRIFNKGKELIKIPDFCSYVIYEMYDDHTKVFYDDKLIVNIKTKIKDEKWYKY